MEPNFTNSPSSDPSLRCLIVEDDRAYAGMLSRYLQSEGWQSDICGTLTDAHQACEQERYHLLLLDNRLPDGMGYTLCPWINLHRPDTIMIMITGLPDLSQAVELTRNGLFDYLTKPLKIDDFMACVRRVRQRIDAKAPSQDQDMLRGESAPIREVVRSLEQAARHPSATVLLTGETGTGKDLAAHVLHRWSHRNQSPTPPFVALNCSALPADMFEAELFGSEKGAYTGADRRRTGLVEAAGRGTLLLDEIAEIPLPLQPKLLRFLESREYRPLGDTVLNTFAGRVVAATNRSLETEVARGTFREDLLYRLDVFSVHLPPVREHMEDLDLLAESLLDHLCQKYQRACPLLREAELDALRQYAFPGNVRELRNLLERSLLKTPEDSKWLALDLVWLYRKPSTSPTPIPPASHPAEFALGDRADLTPIERQEYELIGKTLRDEHGGIRRTANRLGITHQALLRRLQKWPELRSKTAPTT